LLLDRWWDSLGKDVEEVRIEINQLITKQVAGWLMIFVLNIGIVILAVLSTFQSIYIADKLGTIWLCFGLFIGGILVGTVMMDRGIDRIFRRKAKASST
jgi:hypothetical protein